VAYARGELPAIGDRLEDFNGKLGTETSYTGRNLTVHWDEGVVGLEYPLAEQFRLISRAPRAPKK
jgi:hypothetical protein